MMEKVKVWVLLNMSTKWRQWKNELKSKIYDEHKTPEEIIANFNDHRVNINQLKILASYWLTNKAKGQNETNKTNRSKLDESHCTGIRSFPRIVQVLELLKEGINENTSQSRKESSWKDDVLSKVKGSKKKGHVRCMGMIASCSSNRFGPSICQSMPQNVEAEGLKAEVLGLKQALTIVLSLFQQQFPNANVPDIDTATRLLNKEVLDAGSALEITQRNNCSFFKPSP